MDTEIFKKLWHQLVWKFAAPIQYLAHLEGVGRYADGIQASVLALATTAVMWDRKKGPVEPVGIWDVRTAVADLGRSQARLGTVPTSWLPEAVAANMLVEDEPGGDPSVNLPAGDTRYRLSCGHVAWGPWGLKPAEGKREADTLDCWLCLPRASGYSVDGRIVHCDSYRQSVTRTIAGVIERVRPERRSDNAGLTLGDEWELDVPDEAEAPRLETETVYGDRVYVTRDPANPGRLNLAREVREVVAYQQPYVDLDGYYAYGLMFDTSEDDDVRANMDLLRRRLRDGAIDYRTYRALMGPHRQRLTDLAEERDPGLVGVPDVYTRPTEAQLRAGLARFFAAISGPDNGPFWFHPVFVKHYCAGILLGEPKWEAKGRGVAALKAFRAGQKVAEPELF